MTLDAWFIDTLVNMYSLIKKTNIGSYHPITEFLPWNSNSTWFMKAYGGMIEAGWLEFIILKNFILTDDFS